MGGGHRLLLVGCRRCRLDGGGSGGVGRRSCGIGRFRGTINWDLINRGLIKWSLIKWGLIKWGLISRDLCNLWDRWYLCDLWDRAGGKALKLLRSGVDLPRLPRPQFSNAGSRSDRPHRLGGENPEGEGQSAGENRQRQHEAAKYRR
ncbi:hypothetical protein [Mesorhizobium sp.]|uniref:hypothetical protein n=1 Tax=Mesorhizobium sp. TaxID=1871066 RepID=UPI00257AAE24|nr:hypothetical protein [Mesorhizobium sp.]